MDRALPERSIHLPDVRERAQAAFLGLAVGDALGATVEFMTRSEIQAAHGVHREVVGGGWLKLPPARSPTTPRCRSSSRAIAAREFRRAAGGRGARAAAQAPRRRGQHLPAGIQRFMVEGTLEAPYSPGSAGNGAAMRMVPIALATLGDEALLERCALEQAHLTHTHPLSDAACVLVGRLLHLAMLGYSLGQLRSAAEEAAERCAKLRFEPYRGLATGYIVDTMQTVLHCFFCTGSFEECLVETVNQGGDADTTGAIAGGQARTAVAAIRHGLNSAPGGRIASSRRSWSCHRRAVRRPVDDAGLWRAVRRPGPVAFAGPSTRGRKDAH
jgi:ADP-ribosyl-[dinitrogen reductase] hydrolase